MKRLLISGYFGFNNAGDEAVLAAMLEALQAEMPTVGLVVLSNNPERTEKQFRVASVNRWHFFGILRAMANCDLLISGGGSLLQDVTGPKSILYYLAIVQIARWFGKPVVFYAQGIGPVKRSWARRILAHVVNQVTLITVRDEGSRDELAAMGVKKPPVVVTADPVLGWSGAGGAADEFLCRARIDHGPRIGISLRDWPGIEPQIFAEAGDWMVSQGYQVVLLPFQFPGDIAISREVARLMQSESCLIKENLLPGEIMDLVGAMDLIIGMRLHALIMAVAKGVPFVAVSYDPKVDRFAGQVGMNQACPLAELTAECLKTAVAAVFADHQQIRAALAGKEAEFKSKALQNARLVHETLLRENSRKN